MQKYVRSKKTCLTFKFEGNKYSKHFLRLEDTEI